MKNKKHPASSHSKSAGGQKSPVHNTSGAEMPDPNRRQAQSEKDVQEAFKHEPEKTSKRNR